MTDQPSPTFPAAEGSPHGELGCAEVDLLLTEVMTEADRVQAENDALRDQNALYRRTDEARQVEMDQLRAESVRLRALVGDMGTKMRKARDNADGADSQVAMLLSELEAAEAAAVPMDTLLYATLTRAEMTTLYRQASKITRGPLPPAVNEAVSAAENDIRAAMVAAGQDALAKTIRTAVRRRRAAQKKTPPRPAATRKVAGRPGRPERTAG